MWLIEARKARRAAPTVQNLKTNPLNNYKSAKQFGKIKINEI
jgi:hypothetical protein